VAETAWTAMPLRPSDSERYEAIKLNSHFLFSQMTIFIDELLFLPNFSSVHIGNLGLRVSFAKL
jgi:hypothetical protein